MPVVTGEQKLYVAVERAADIRGVLALKQEFPKLDIGAGRRDRRLAGCGGHRRSRCAGDRQWAGRSACQLRTTRRKPEQCRAARASRGEGGAQRCDHAGSAPLAAGGGQSCRAHSACRGATGMAWGKAFAAISSVPAEISGMGGKAGVLKPGALGDVVLWDGDPLEVGLRPDSGVHRRGVEQSLESHQSGLRDRYRDLDEKHLAEGLRLVGSAATRAISPRRIMRGGWGMDESLVGLIAANVAFVGSHFAMSHPLRAPMVKATGARAGFRRPILSSALRRWAGSISPFKAAPPADLPGSGDIGWIIATVLTLPAMILLAGSLIGNPGTANTDGRSPGPRDPKRCLQGDPPSDDVGDRAVGALAHRAVVEHPYPDRRAGDGRPRAGRCAVAGPQERDSDGRSLGRVGKQDQLLAAMGQAVVCFGPLPLGVGAALFPRLQLAAPVAGRHSGGGVEVAGMRRPATRP